MPAGRPKIKINPEKVKALAAQGLSERQIAKLLGINWKTLAARKKESKEFADLLEQGRAIGIQKVCNSMFVNAINGDFQAQKWFLSNRDPENWRDRKQNVLTGPDDGPIEVEHTGAKDLLTGLLGIGEDEDED